MKIGKTRALMIVDVQRDFCEGGALAVEGGTRVARSITDHLMEPAGAAGAYDLVIASRDWHAAPPDTNGGHFGDPPDYVDSWPVHCVAGEDGAEYHPELCLPENTVHVYKGMGRPDYSALQGVTEHGTPISKILAAADIGEIVVVGIATDHCVRASTLDLIALLRMTAKVTVRVDMVAGVDPDRSRKALSEIVAMGGALDWAPDWLGGFRS